MARAAALGFAVVFGGGLILLLLWRGSSSTSRSGEPSVAKPTARPSSAPLDFNKPVMTRAYAAICPVSLISDPRADHSPAAWADAISSTFSRSEKLARLGCEEWQEGIRVIAQRVPDGDKDSDLVLIDRFGYGDAGEFTITSQLENAPDRPETPESPTSAPARTIAPSAPILQKDESSAPAVSDAESKSLIRDNAVAQGWGASPGAIACADQQSVDAMYKRFEQAGPSADLLDGCILIKPGTTLHTDQSLVGPRVTVVIPGPKIFIGMTKPEMVAPL